MYPLLLDYLKPHLRYFHRIPLHIAYRFFLIGAGLLIIGMVGAFAVVPLNSELLPEMPLFQVNEMDLQHIQDQLKQLEQKKGSYLREEVVRYGDTLAILLARLQIQDPRALNILMHNPQAHQLIQLKAGRSIQVLSNEQGQLLWLRYLLPAGSNVAEDTSHILMARRREDNSFSIHTEIARNSVETEIRSGVIQNSLYAATDAADIPDAVANQMADILAGDIDFHRDLRKGDYFRVIYENYIQQGEPTGSGKIVGLEFYANKRLIQAVRYGDEYYTPAGKNLKKAFLRSPMPFTRVTSGFAMRMHPILKTWRAHTGVDYGAPNGTPIRAVADGIVDFVGKKGGYGNAVVLRHGVTYSTLYGHMSRFAKDLKKGSRVTQGMVIGYVGQTGWATGPHLHYEFMVNGAYRNPLTVPLPDARPLDVAQLPNLKLVYASMQNKLALAVPLDHR